MKSATPSETPVARNRRPWRVGTKIFVVLWIVVGLLWLLSILALLTAQNLGTVCLLVLVLTFLLQITAILGVATLAYVVYRIVEWVRRRPSG